MPEHVGSSDDLLAANPAFAQRGSTTTPFAYRAPQSALDDLKQRLAQVAARARHPRSTAPGEHHDR